MWNKNNDKAIKDFNIEDVIQKGKDSEKISAEAIPVEINSETGYISDIVLPEGEKIVFYLEPYKNIGVSKIYISLGGNIIIEADKKTLKKVDNKAKEKDKKGLYKKEDKRVETVVEGKYYLCVDLDAFGHTPTKEKNDLFKHYFVIEDNLAENGIANQVLTEKESEFYSTFYNFIRPAVITRNEKKGVITKEDMGMIYINFKEVETTKVITKDNILEIKKQTSQ